MIKGDKTLGELAQQLDVDANQVTESKRQLLERAGDMPRGGGTEKADALFGAPGQ